MQGWYNIWKSISIIYHNNKIEKPWDHFTKLSKSILQDS